jgi:hypothetical protein
MPSKSLPIHLLRGAAGIGAVWLAVRIGEAHPIGALGLVLVALASFRGCPVCWTAGLIETISRRR